MPAVRIPITSPANNPQNNVSSVEMRKLLLLIPTTSYRTHSFLKAARSLGVEIVVGSNLRQILEQYSHGGTLTLDFRNLEKGTQQIVDYAKAYPLEAIVSVEEETNLLAANASSVLKLPHNSFESIFNTGNKFRMRKILAKAGLPSPEFHLFPADGNPEEFVTKICFPCVLKPTFLSASRGVIRANDASGFVSAFHRIRNILNDPELQSMGGKAANEILVEDYIPGKEVALEGLLVKKELQVLAVFDKPDPLEGPFFEETLYITPSRLSTSVQKKIASCAANSAQALGLWEGPIHAEMRINKKGVWLIEIAARSIGGFCSRTLRFGTGLSLEEIILRHALCLPIETMEKGKQASGVMMIPIPSGGVLKEVRGESKAKRVLGIEEVNILIPLGKNIVLLPEGHEYLGFIFSRGESPEIVEASLREAHRELEFIMDPL